MSIRLRIATIATVSALSGLTGIVPAAETGHLRLNDGNYFETRGVNVLVYSNRYDGLFSDSKISGIELIHHGVRTATNGDVRLNATPEQWDAIPQFVERQVDREEGRIRAQLRYPEFDFDFAVEARSAGDAVLLSVHLPAPLPEELEGKAGFNLEFLPAAYFGHSWVMDDTYGLFPLYPFGLKERNDGSAPQPLAGGHSLTLAPENPERTVTLESADVQMALYDGRARAQNGWFVVRSLLPAGRSGKVLEWSLRARSIDGWTRAPVIGHSQVGYHPRQHKVAVIELDQNDGGQTRARLWRVDGEGAPALELEAVPPAWGDYKRYSYRLFDFSAIEVEGVYFIEYGPGRTAPFVIADDVFRDVWHPTLDLFFPIQMDHVAVNEAYRVWHGASHLDDALQAPVNHEHFDLYAQGPTTDTPYAPGEHIPGLDVGGWYDAGDYDIRTQSQYYVVNHLVDVWETFGLTRDTTSVDYERKFVDLHVADGKPDLLQQIEHGALALVAQHRAVGHAIPGIVAPDLGQYTHLGDGQTKTDNRVYNPELDDTEANGRESGVFDDRWAFTSRSSALNYGSAAALAAASRALDGYNDALAAECLQIALAVWEDEQSREPDTFRHGNTTGGPLAAEEMKAALELLVTTGEERYAQRFLDYLPEIERRFAGHAALAVRAMPHLDDDYKATLRELTFAHRRDLDALQESNPYGVPISEGGWAGNGQVIGLAVANYRLHRVFPEIIDEEDVFRGLNYLFGTHPGSDISFVSAVGARSKQVAYGMNRADWSFVPGGIVPGVLMIKPDYPENKEDWPFLWGQNEYVITVGASYLFLANAVQELVQERATVD